MKHEEIIQDLCLLYGSGYRGEVIYEVNKGFGWSGPFREGLDTHQIRYFLIPERIGGEPRRGHKVYRNIHVPQKPFTDLLKKDAEGVCDAERVAEIAFNKPDFEVEYRFREDVDVGTVLVMECLNETVELLEDYNIFTVSWGANTAGITDFLRSKGYLIPQSLEEKP